jgi:uncharacterized protein with PQ loop repeat
MTREEFLKRFKWDTVMWLVGFVNIVALIPQPMAIVRTQNVSGIAIEMFVLFAFVQTAVAIESFIKRSYGLMTSMIASAVLSVSTICLVLYYR